MGARKSETSFRKKTKALISLAYYISELLGKGTIDKRSSGETKGRQGSSSRNYDVLGRELYTPDEVRKLDNKKLFIFIRGFDPIIDNKFIPFAHPVFDQTADGKGEAYVHRISKDSNLVGVPFEILTKRSLKHYEELKEKGGNIFIDELTYEEFMLLGNEELGRRFTSMDEKEQKEKLNSEQSKELEFSEETVSSTANNEASSGGASMTSRKHLKEDTVMNRMVYWDFSAEQKTEGKKALAAKIPKQTILSYFYPETPIGEMVQIRESIEKKRHA